MTGNATRHMTWDMTQDATQDMSGRTTSRDNREPDNSPREDRAFEHGGGERNGERGGESGGRDEGSALVWVLLLMPVLMALLGLIFDGGAAINGSQEADNVADQAARAGADQLDTTSVRAAQGLYGPADSARAANAACAYVAVASPHMTCSASVDADAVIVAVSATVQTQFFAVIGINELTVHGDGSADSHTGIDEEIK